MRIGKMIMRVTDGFLGGLVGVLWGNLGGCFGRFLGRDLRLSLGGFLGYSQGRSFEQLGRACFGGRLCGLWGGLWGAAGEGLEVGELAGGGLGAVGGVEKINEL